MKRSLLLILMLLCGLYLILTMKGDAVNESSQTDPLSDFEDYPVYSDGDYPVV